MKALLVGFLILVGVLIAVGQDENPGNEATKSTETVDTRDKTPSTTVPQGLIAADLPVINATSAVDNVKVAQTLVNTFSSPISVDGSWGPQTAAAVTKLREVLGVSEGDSIDRAVWEVVISKLEAPTARTDFGKTEIRSLQNMKLPTGLVLTEISTLQDVSTAWTYVAPPSVPIVDLASTLSALNPTKSLGGWRFCETENKTSVAQMRRFWWALPERMLSLVVQQTNGVNEVVVTEEQSVPLDGCEGYKTTPTTEKAAPKASESSGGGDSGSGSYGGGGASCYVGMNLEDCEDLIGLSAGDRIQYIDCTGEDREVWWARNWTIIGFYGGAVVVSKSSYGCA